MEEAQHLMDAGEAVAEAMAVVDMDYSGQERGRGHQWACKAESILYDCAEARQEG